MGLLANVVTCERGDEVVNVEGRHSVQVICEVVDEGVVKFETAVF